ncbi:MAG: DUF6766 family protein [Chitinophagales bacterium]|nr:DUF6766 family protein [Chitinophagales bacterium]
MKRFFRRNSLSIVLLVCMLISWAGQMGTGFMEHNNELEEKGASTIPFGAYLRSGHFIQATFENWESEFLQMALYILFTVWLRQKGSSESKRLAEEGGEVEEVDRMPVPHANAPWPVKKGGWRLVLYRNSLSLAFIILFLISFLFHFYGSWSDFNTEQLLEGKPSQSVVAFLSNPKFWFESFQNWQSEFLAVFSIVVLSIFLRQYGSPESKPVDAPHSETGK